MENNIYLSSEKLDTLTNRVAKKIEYLKLMNRQNMWDEPIDYCKQIEQSVMAVDTVVLAVMEEKGHFQTSSSYPYNYQMMMARIYILLYYRHCGEALYNTIVFPAIKEKMGTFRDKYLNDINSKLDEVLKMEELINKTKQESQKDLKPKFPLVYIEKGKSDELFDEYNEEQLFRSLSPALDILGKKNQLYIDAAEIWYNAKETVKKLWQVNYPERYIKRILNNQYTQLGHANAALPQIIMMCVYAMMRSVKKTDHFKQTIEVLDGCADVFRPEGNYLLHDNMKEWKMIFDTKDVFDDYDYVGEEPTKNTFTSADIVKLQQRFEQQTEALNRQLKEKEDLIVELKQQIANYGNDEQEKETNDEVKAAQKVRLDLLLKLIEKDGADLEKHGNKTKAAEIMKEVTGLPFSTCKNYCTNKDLNVTEHEEAILKLNSKLQALGMSIRL
jgi:hypothetical protein